MPQAKQRTKKPTLLKIRHARTRLRGLIDKACIARGEAQWTNGYRAARLSCGAESEAEDQRLYAKEMGWFRQCATTERACERAIANFERLVRLGK